MDKGLRQSVIDKHHPLSIRRQCDLLQINRSMLYYIPASESAENLALMEQIDRLHLRFPYYGVVRMRDKLRLKGY